MTALTARNIALADQILALLDAEAPLPIASGDLYRKLGRVPVSIFEQQDGNPGPPDPVYYSDFYRVLSRLARLGEVEKWPADGDRRCCYWRRLTIPEAPGGAR